MCVTNTDVCEEIVYEVSNAAQNLSRFRWKPQPSSCGRGGGLRSFLVKRNFLSSSNCPTHLTLSSSSSDKFIRPVPRSYLHYWFISHQNDHHLHQQPCSPVLSCWFCWAFPVFSPSQWHRVRFCPSSVFLFFILACINSILLYLLKSDRIWKTHIHQTWR